MAGWLEGIVGRRRAGLDVVLLQLCLKVSDLGAQVRVLRLHGLGMAADCGASGDAVGGAAGRPVLLAWCAALGAAIAAYLAHLPWWLVVSLCLGRRVHAMTSLAQLYANVVRRRPSTSIDMHQDSFIAHD